MAIHWWIECILTVTKENNGKISNLQTLNSFSLHYTLRFVQITQAYIFRCSFVSTSLRSSPQHSTTFANGCSTELWDTTGYRIGIGRQLFKKNGLKGAQLLFSCDFLLYMYKSPDKRVKIHVNISGHIRHIRSCMILVWYLYTRYVLANWCGIDRIEAKRSD